MRLIVSHLRLWSPLVREGGVLLGDDYLGHWKAVRKAVDEFAAKVGATVEVYGHKWLLRVPSPKPAAWPRLPPKRTVWAFEGGAGGRWCGQEEERRDVRRDERRVSGARRGVLVTKGERRSGGYTIMGAGFAVCGRGGGVSACTVQRLYRRARPYPYEVREERSSKYTYRVHVSAELSVQYSSPRSA